MQLLTTIVAAATLALAALPSVSAQNWQTGRCTYHPYEEDKARLGASYDNSPGWCGIRYSALNAARIVAVNGLGTGMCAQCIPCSCSPSTKRAIPVSTLLARASRQPFPDPTRSTRKCVPGASSLRPTAPVCALDRRRVHTWCPQPAAGLSASSHWPSACSPTARSAAPLSSLASHLRVHLLLHLLLHRLLHRLASLAAALLRLHLRLLHLLVHRPHPTHPLHHGPICLPTADLHPHLPLAAVCLLAPDWSRHLFPWPPRASLQLL
ncbi:hypothetical protein BC831DRAFT_228438 [Entophlyctis helioformis]|nr:hypothetical protein BC831DRAFT_228438 [Entophlyctis helioformis]